MTMADLGRSGVLAIAGLLLAGCADSDWQDMNPFAEHSTTAPVAAFAVAAPPDDRLELFCRGYAHSEAWNAAQLRIGVAEQERISDRAYKDCILLG